MIEIFINNPSLPPKDNVFVQIPDLCSWYSCSLVKTKVKYLEISIFSNNVLPSSVDTDTNDDGRG